MVSMRTRFDSVQPYTNWRVDIRPAAGPRVRVADREGSVSGLRVAIAQVHEASYRDLVFRRETADKFNRFIYPVVNGLEEAGEKPIDLVLFPEAPISIGGKSLEKVLLAEDGSRNRTMARPEEIRAAVSRTMAEFSLRIGVSYVGLVSDRTPGYCSDIYYDYLAPSIENTRHFTKERFEKRTQPFGEAEATTLLCCEARDQNILRFNAAGRETAKRSLVLFPTCTDHGGMREFFTHISRAFGLRVPIVNANPLFSGSVAGSYLLQPGNSAGKMELMTLPHEEGVYVFDI